MIDLDTAQELLKGAVKGLPPVQLPLDETLGARLAEAVTSNLDLPHWDVSAMDGYAVRAADLATGGQLPVVFEVAAGMEPPPLPAETAARIFTGAVIPEGADTVVPQELARRSDEGGVTLEPLPAGSHFRARGEIIRRGATLAEAGTVVTPALLGLLAAGGVTVVKVYSRPRVGLLVTGSELVSAAESPRPGEIRDANGPMLTALAVKAGFEIGARSTAADDVTALKTVLEELLEGSDMIVTSGGVSVGDHDLVPRAAVESGGEVIFHRVAVKPGKPVLVARFGNRWLVGLPGNSVSVLTDWNLFALPVGLALAGDREALPVKPCSGILAGPAVNKSSQRTLLHPAQLKSRDGVVRLSPLPWKGSHDLATVADMNALLRLKPGSNCNEGEQVPYYPLV